MAGALWVAATVVAFQGVLWPNPFPFLLLAAALVIVAGCIHERREERGR